MKPSQESLAEARALIEGHSTIMPMGRESLSEAIATALDKARREERVRCAACCLRMEFSHQLSGEKREAAALAKASRLIAEGKFVPLPEDVEAIRARESY